MISFSLFHFTALSSGRPGLQSELMESSAPPEDDEVGVHHHHHHPHPGPDAVNPPPHRLTSGPISVCDASEKGKRATNVPGKDNLALLSEDSTGETVAAETKLSS